MVAVWNVGNLKIQFLYSFKKLQVQVQHWADICRFSAGDLINFKVTDTKLAFQYYSAEIWIISQLPKWFVGWRARKLREFVFGGTEGLKLEWRKTVFFCIGPFRIWNARRPKNCDEKCVRVIFALFYVIDLLLGFFMVNLC